MVVFFLFRVDCLTSVAEGRKKEKKWKRKEYLVRFISELIDGASLERNIPLSSSLILLFIV